MRLIFIDLETGGLDPAKHPITQVACIAVDSVLKEIESLEIKLRFNESDADPEALAITSYDRDVWDSQAVASHVAISKLSGFFKRYADVRMASNRTGNPYFVAQLVGHNAATFDGPFLQAFYKRHDAFMPASYRVLCTLQRAAWHFLELQERDPKARQPENLKLETLCEFFNKPLADAHDALADVRATLAVYRSIVVKDTIDSWNLPTSSKEPNECPL